MRYVITIFVLGILIGCTEPAGVSVDVHSGVRAIRSDEVRQNMRDGTRVSARVVSLRAADGTTSHAILTYVARADLNYPKIQEVWSFGRRLPYIRIDRQRAGSLRAEAGRIPLSRRALELGAIGGADFRLFGPRGAYDVSLPPETFGQVVERMVPAKD